VRDRWNIELETPKNSDLRQLWGGLLGKLGISRSGNSAGSNNRPWLCLWAAWQHWHAQKLSHQRCCKARMLVDGISFPNRSSWQQHLPTQTNIMPLHQHPSTQQLNKAKVRLAAIQLTSTWEIRKPNNLWRRGLNGFSYTKQMIAFCLGPTGTIGGSIIDVSLKLFHISICGCMCKNKELNMNMYYANYCNYVCFPV